MLKKERERKKHQKTNHTRKLIIKKSNKIPGIKEFLLTTIILSNLNRLPKNFSGSFLVKFVVQWILKIPPHLACVALLP